MNSWLALTFQSHVHHKEMAVWFEGLEENSVYFCRLSMLGFLRLAQLEAAFPGEAVTAEQAWGFYEGYLGDERVGFKDEPPGVDHLLAGYLGRVTQKSPNVVTDAYLAAFARLEGLKLHTFDRALAKHPLLLH
ncbi:TA system VapC family ribonuclease toxin [Phragmitibacter flavus]|uniref:TA system VapC family ribonuclease toxin n=1 Tax=Phragmitibacter flavus TaxID=2576071 RepID=UPI00140D8E1C|nr:TA system VapC family ribonuclease toxin [Phragmitibacter flavus]